MDYLGDLLALGVDIIVIGGTMKVLLNTSRVLAYLKETKVHDVYELEKIMEAQGEDQIPFVAVAGSVKAVGAPMYSFSAPDITGVVHRVTLMEHLRTRGYSGFWTSHSRLAKEYCNEVPFVIQSGGRSAEVKNALSADVLDLFTISESYEVANPSWFNYVHDFFLGMRMTGVRTREDILREGTVVTCFGEVTIDKMKNQVKIQHPLKGLPYIITANVSKLVDDLYQDVTRYKICLSVAITIGVGICGFAAYRWWRERRSKMKKEQRRQQREAARNARVLSGEPEELPPIQVCVVCCDNPREIILFPCGHFCMCEDCSDLITTNCPMCRAIINSRSNAYF